MSTRPSTVFSPSSDHISDVPRVALFQAFWRLHSNTLFAALTLSRAGYYVDIFLFRVNEVVPTSLLQQISGVSVHDLDLPSGKNLAVSTAARDEPIYRAAIRLFKSFRHSVLKESQRNLKRFLTLLRFLTGSAKGLVPSEVLKRSFAILQGRQYRALIGIDKGGLVWAGAMASRLGCPLIYSSLELYTRDHWFYSGCYTQKRLKLAEEHYHPQCWATIVQDEARGRVLLADNRVQGEMRMLYVPISRLGEPEARKSHWLQERLGLPDRQVVILSHGMIARMRFSLELAMVAQAFPDNWTMVIHGYGESSIIQKIREIDSKSKVSLSLDLVDLSEEQMIVRSATVSLVFYRDKYVNDRLTGLSSEKLALSLQCGVPVVAFDYPSYGHIREEECGVLIKDISEISVAVSKILADYSGYRSRALLTFKKYYQFEANFRKVLSALDELV